MGYSYSLNEYLLVFDCVSEKWWKLGDFNTVTNNKLFICKYKGGCIIHTCPFKIRCCTLHDGGFLGPDKGHIA